MSQFLHVFLSQLKDKELAKLDPGSKKWYRGPLIAHLSSTNLTEDQWNVLEALEYTLNQRKEEGRCINPETGHVIHWEGPTYQRLTAMGMDLHPLSLQAIREKSKYPTVVDKVVDEVIQNQVDLYDDLLSALSDELILEMAGWLEADSLRQLCIVNKRFFLVSEDPALKKVLDGNCYTHRFSGHINTWLNTIESYHYCFVDGEGDVYVWGHNTSGSLGLGKGTHRKRIDIPVQVDVYGKKIRSVVTTSQNTAFITTQGRLYLCGTNSYGRLGNPNGFSALKSKKKVSYSSVPIVPLLPAHVRVSQVIFWRQGVVLLTTEGELYGWGNFIYRSYQHARISEPTQLLKEGPRFYRIYSAYDCRIWALSKEGTYILDKYVAKRFRLEKIATPLFQDVATTVDEIFALVENEKGDQEILVYENKSGIRVREWTPHTTIPIQKSRVIQMRCYRQNTDTYFAYLTENGFLTLEDLRSRKTTRLDIQEVQDFYFYQWGVETGILVCTSEGTFFYRIQAETIHPFQLESYLEGKIKPFS